MIQNIYSKFNEVSLKKIFDFLAHIDLEDFHLDQLGHGLDHPNEVSLARDPPADAKKRPLFSKSQTAKSQEDPGPAQRSPDLGSEPNTILKVPPYKK